MLLSICTLIPGTSRKCWWSVCWVCAWSVLACVGASDHFITGRNDLTTLSHGHLFCPSRTCRKMRTQMIMAIQSEWTSRPLFEFKVDFECSFKIKIFMPLIIKFCDWIKKKACQFFFVRFWLFLHYKFTKFSCNILHKMYKLPFCHHLNMTCNILRIFTI